jgi:hypothetical protein
MIIPQVDRRDVFPLEAFLAPYEPGQDPQENWADGGRMMHRLAAADVVLVRDTMSGVTHVLLGRELAERMAAGELPTRRVICIEIDDQAGDGLRVLCLLRVAGGRR